jgi:hypothetical protein
MEHSLDADGDEEDTYGAVHLYTTNFVQKPNQPQKFDVTLTLGFEPETFRT